MVFSAIPDACGSVVCALPWPLSILAARILSFENPSKLRFTSSMSEAFPSFLVHVSWRVFLFWYTGPVAVHFGHAGHEEYPALTWHIRLDDWDRLAARSGRGYYKKEGKREMGGSE